MAISRNPTRTAHIEKAWQKEVEQRHNVLKRQANERFRFINNATFQWTEQQIAEFIAWFRQASNETIVGNDGDWQYRYINHAYVQSIEVTTAQMRQLGIEVPFGDNFDILRQTMSDEDFASFIIAQLPPEERQSVEGVQLRAADALQDNVNEMVATTRRALSAAIGVESESDVRSVITTRINVDISNGKRIATTETVQAFQKGQIDNARRMEERTGQPIELRWLTRMDDRVRNLHAQWHGVVMSQQEAERRINISPWNCRCGFALVPPDANTARRQRMFDKEREQLLALERGTND